ncbi:MAG: putative ABC transporter permease [Lachnospiraceae bacterium]|nr:putative ABC transporter permease [Lachnospiraceae bacterium]
MKIIEKISRLIILFTAAAFTGWVYEIACMWLLYGVYADRGVLHLPLCPIYGFGLLILMAVFARIKKGVALFLGSTLVTTAIELAVSYILEYGFHMVLWTYEDWPFNFQNRISLISSCVFGLMGLFIIKGVKPPVEKLYATRYKKAAVTAVYIFLCFCIVWELMH